MNLAQYHYDLQEPYLKIPIDWSRCENAVPNSDSRQGDGDDTKKLINKVVISNMNITL
jgi:hypothetical protein